MQGVKLFQHSKEWEAFSAGQIIFSEGQPGEVMYVILEGEVDIQACGKLIETIHAGDMFGEMALVDSEPRSAKTVARTDCKLVPINKKRFAFLVTETPFFALEVMQVMANRLRKRR
ncbi:MAG: cyclic nucleotide-binding domain-containing protein [Nitrospiraceae bacterium]|nr:cyclic nucleotide-binding domain-containing protein [Nitrospiraceae bacterium]